MEPLAIKSYDDIQTLYPNEKNFSYRPIIVWAMNDKLCQAELKRQLKAFKDCGYGGVMVMPWGGLPYDFMSADWLDAVRYILQCATELELDIWLWDDWLFGSGPAGGKLTKNPSYRAKTLKVIMDFVLEPGESVDFIVPPRAISGGVFAVDKFSNPIDESCEAIDIASGGRMTIEAEVRKRVMVVGWEYMSGMQHTTHSHGKFLDPAVSSQESDIFTCEDSSVWSVNMMNPVAIGKYLGLIHEQYWREIGEFFGNTLKGFFYDEPKASTNRPWTEDFAERFQAIKGYDLNRYLVLMMVVYRRDTADFNAILRPEVIKKAEADYKEVWTTLVAESFYGTIQQWCQAHNVMATGHPIGDNSLEEVFSNGGYYFKNMDFSDMPGVDTVGGFNQIVPGTFLDFSRLAGSRAAVSGKRRAMSESFAVYGHGLDLNHMRYTCEHQIIRGINTFFCKLSNYNREKSFYFHPPELSEYNPIIKHFGPSFCRRINNIATLMNSGKSSTPRIGLYVATSNYFYDDPTIAKQITTIAEYLTYNQLEFDYLWDNDILDLQERNTVFTSSSGQSYSNIVLPQNIITPPLIKEKLESLEQKNNLCDLQKITLQEMLRQCKENPNQILKSISNNKKIAMRTRTLEQGIQCCMLLNESDRTEPLSMAVTQKATLFELDLDTWQVLFLTEASPTAPIELEFAASQSRILICDTKNKFALPSQTQYSPTEEIHLLKWSLKTPDGNTILPDNPLPDWRQLGWPGFAGFMRYSCQFTWNKEKGNALLSLGEVCYAATVFLDNKKVGNCVFAPFTIQMNNLSPGKHRLDIDVLNTPANEIFGDNKKLKSLRNTRVFEGTYAPLYEKLDLLKLRSGLLGPVKLHNTQTNRIAPDSQ